jgi:hypothetical protein
VSKGGDEGVEGITIFAASHSLVILSEAELLLPDVESFHSNFIETSRHCNEMFGILKW